MTLKEIYQTKTLPSFLERVYGAMIVTAHSVLGESPTSADRQAWATSTIRAPRNVASSFAAYALAANKEVTVEQVLSAPDSEYEDNIASAVDAMVGPPDAPA